MKRSHWTKEEQKKQIGEAMAIATTANLLLGLRCTETGREYANSMVTYGGMDRELCEAGAEYILIPMLPFAVELCLKGIRSQGGGEFLWKHNLKSLWNDLEEAERIEIRRRVAAPRDEERTQREILSIPEEMRTVDQVIDDHRNDFRDWRYVVDGEKTLTGKKRARRIEEAIMDLYGLVYACVEYYKSRDAQQQ